MKPERPIRSDWRHFSAIETRWIDNDIYGHINNVVYYAMFDTAVADWLMSRGLFDPLTSQMIYLVVDSGCTYFESVSHPAVLEIGLKAGRVGRTSVTYSIGVFRRESNLALACGHFVHVAVDRGTKTPVSLSAELQAALLTL